MPKHSIIRTTRIGLGTFFSWNYQNRFVYISLQTTRIGLGTFLFKLQESVWVHFSSNYKNRFGYISLQTTRIGLGTFLFKLQESVWVHFLFPGLFQLYQLVFLQYWILCLTYPRLDWSRFTGSIKEASEKRGGAHMGFPERIDTILNWTFSKLWD